MALPNGYTRLEYIQSSGSQYIDTGFKPNQNTRIVLDFENIGNYSSMTTGLCPLFGVRNASTVACFALWVGTKSFPQYGNAAYNANGNFTIDINERLTYEMNKNVVSIGGQVITCSSASFTTNYNLCLFTINNYGTIEARRASGKLWSAKIYDNGTLIRDFVPCKNSSSVVGLYDLVNDVFYTNVGSGTFTAGAEVLPDYKLVDANELDEAISATADAIREKTGDSAKIAWDRSRGFAGTITTIPTGAKVATGTFQKTTHALKTNPIKITGLSFAPTTVIFYLDINNRTEDDSSLDDYVFYGEFTASTKMIKCLNAYCYEDEDGESYGGLDIYDYKHLVVTTLTSDGFTIATVNDYDYVFTSEEPYKWIALG